jgi:transketolase
LHLGKLIYLYDDNRISIDGSTDLAFTEDRGARFEAYGWQVQTVEDGNDLEAISRAITAAREITTYPSLISVKTHIGYGSPTKQDSFEVHGSPLGPDEVISTKKNTCRKTRIHNRRSKMTENPTWALRKRYLDCVKH